MNANTASRTDKKTSSAIRAWIACGGLGAAALLAACSDRGVTKQADSSAVPSSPSSSTGTLSNEVTSGSGGTNAGGIDTAASLPSLGQRPPDAAETRTAWLEGVSLYESGDYQGASSRLSVAAAGRPGQAYTHYLLGLSLWKSGQTKQAEEALARAATLEGGSARTWVNLARVRMDLGDPSGALEAADSALAIGPFSAHALHQRGRALASLGRGPEALETLRQAHDADPSNGFIANTLGYHLIRSGHEPEALPFLKMASEKLPNVGYVRNNLGVAYERTGQVERAVEEYRAAVASGDSDGKAVASLARLEPQLADRTAREPETRLPEDPAIAKSASGQDPDATTQVPKD